MKQHKVDNLILLIQNMKIQINWVNKVVVHKHLLKRIIYILQLDQCTQNWHSDINNNNQIKWKNQFNFNNHKIQSGKHQVDQIHIRILFPIIYQIIHQSLQKYILNQPGYLLLNFNHSKRKRMIRLLIVINHYLNKINVTQIERRVLKQEQKLVYYNLNSK